MDRNGLVRKIEALGAAVFLDDRDIKGGDSIPQTILQRIRETDEFVVLLTPESILRQWVLIEIGIAAGVERRIIPLLYHIDAAQIPDMIRDNRGFQLNDLDKYLGELSDRKSAK